MGQIDIIGSSFSLPLVSWTSHLVPWCGAKISPHPYPTTFVWAENPCGVKRGEASQVRWGKIAIHTGKVNRQDAHYISYPSIKDYSLEHLIKLFKLLKEKKKEAVTLFEIYNTRSSHFHHKNGQLCSFQKASLVSLYPDLKKFCTKLLGKMQKSPIWFVHKSQTPQLWSMAHNLLWCGLYCVTITCEFGIVFLKKILFTFFRLFF